MGYIKVVKNKNYYKRYQTKMRRRRECKTNYKLRTRLVKQDKRKYNVPKWRLIARITNKDVIVQVASAKANGDHVLCAAYSHELPRYGVKCGLTNYAACYATGLLCARRLLKKLNMDIKYPGKKKLDGRKFLSTMKGAKWEAGDKVRRPFKCILDVGLARTSRGARVFACMKGAVDGGVHVPHSVRKFPGYTRDKEARKDKYDADAHKQKIFGGHVAYYMGKLKEEDPDKYERHFSQYIKAGVEGEQLEDLYRSAHSQIRADPAAAPKKEARDYKGMDVRLRTPRMSYDEKAKRLAARIQTRRDAIAAAAAQ
jgi:large subunit ribosomal protein L5e